MDGFHLTLIVAAELATLTRMRQVYLAATGMNRGKTTFALGLLAALKDRGLRTGFIKPVGQRYAVVDGHPADEDAILVRAVFGMTDAAGGHEPGPHPARASPRRSSTGEVTDDLEARIVAAHREAGDGQDVLLVEGTGHAGVGLGDRLVQRRRRARCSARRR